MVTAVLTAYMTVLRLNENGGIQLGGQVMPLVAITCMNCGNTVFVNPLVIKSVDVDDDEEKNNG